MIILNLLRLLLHWTQLQSNPLGTYVLVSAKKCNYVKFVNVLPTDLFK